MHHDRASSRSHGALECIALLSAAGLLLTPALRGIARRWRVHHPRAATERGVDSALDDTFPASDPPASRYVDIPVNRR